MIHAMKRTYPKNKTSKTSNTRKQPTGGMRTVVMRNMKETANNDASVSQILYRI